MPMVETMELLQKRINETEVAMIKNLNTNLYADDWCASPPLKRSLVARTKTWLGQLFIKAANALGEYEEYY